MKNLSLRRIARPTLAISFAVLAISLAAAVPATAATHAAAAPSSAASAAHSRAAASPALPPAYLEKTQYLTNTPLIGMTRSCISRNIFLDSGNYSFYDFLATNGGSDTYPTLPSTGTYQWAACLIPVPSYTTEYPHGYYTLEVSLTDPTGGRYWTLSDNLALANSGTWTWGSGLNPLF